MKLKALVLALILTSLLALTALAGMPWHMGPAPAQVVSPQAKLRKLSLHLRGFLPSDSEYADAADADAKLALDSFLEAKAREYVKTPEHVAKMMTRLDELYRMKVAPIPPEQVFDSSGTHVRYERLPDGDFYPYLNALDATFQAIARDNLSWDTLLTGTRYLIYGPNAPDAGFLEAQAPGMGKVNGMYLDFPAGDPRIAGTITTHRFAERYVNTATNHDRRRAAAVFRIFLCDDMKPGFVPSQNDIQDLIDLIFPSSTGKTEAGAPAPMPAEKRHGSDAACMACHYKLDPLANTFRGMGSRLFDKPFPGALVYHRDDGSLVNIPVSGIGDLARAIVAQPEYSACQVRHFWDWFIGRDAPLTDARKAELVREFDGMGRRTDDFIVHLVTSKDFYEPPTPPSPAELPWYRVSRHLSACSSCHMSSGDNDAPPTFMQFPFGGSEKDQAKWIRRIIDALDLESKGLKVKMPPPEALWPGQAKEEAKEAIRQWICAGAPDPRGKPSIGASDIPPAMCASKGGMKP